MGLLAVLVRSEAVGQVGSLLHDPCGNASGDSRLTRIRPEWSTRSGASWSSGCTPRNWTRSSLVDSRTSYAVSSRRPRTRWTKRVREPNDNPTLHNVKPTLHPTVTTLLHSLNPALPPYRIRLCEGTSPAEPLPSPLTHHRQGSVQSRAGPFFLPDDADTDRFRDGQAVHWSCRRDHAGLKTNPF